jgi:hypothetical protein
MLFKIEGLEKVEEARAKFERGWREVDIVMLGREGGMEVDEMVKPHIFTLLTHVEHSTR